MLLTYQTNNKVLKKYISDIPGNKGTIMGMSFGQTVFIFGISGSGERKTIENDIKIKEEKSI